VLVSAAITSNGGPRRLLEAWRGGEIELVISPALLAELRTVLARPKFRRYLSLDEVERFVAHIRQEAELRADPQEASRVVADPDDDYLVALARATHADVLVSGDAHLTELDLGHPPVMTPARLFEALASGD
jgi:putative PIN family toxin of toxin-antitoxin system